MYLNTNIPSFNPTAVLKTTENLGVSYVKLSEDYKKKLSAESKTLNFPYRLDAVSIFSMTYNETCSAAFANFSVVL